MEKMWKVFHSGSVSGAAAERAESAGIFPFSRELWEKGEFYPVETAEKTEVDPQNAPGFPQECAEGAEK